MRVCGRGDGGGDAKCVVDSIRDPIRSCPSMRGNGGGGGGGGGGMESRAYHLHI